MTKKELEKQVKDLKFELERFKILYEAVEENLKLDDRTAICGIRAFFRFDKNLNGEVKNDML